MYSGVCASVMMSSASNCETVIYESLSLITFYMPGLKFIMTGFSVSVYILFCMAKTLILLSVDG